jgi:RNase H
LTKVKTNNGVCKTKKARKVKKKRPKIACEQKPHESIKKAEKPTIIISKHENVQLTDDDARRQFHIPSHAHLIYTDGSCIKKGAFSRAGVGVYFGLNDSRNISSRLAGSRQTNTRAEIYAILKALEALYLDMNSEYEVRLVYILTDWKTAVDVMESYEDC